MIEIWYFPTVICITVLWVLVRVFFAVKMGKVSWKREVQLLLVYICLVVVVRFTFFPFSKVNGKIQPLVFEVAKALPPRINWIPFVNLMDYPEKREALLNLIGNTTMFIPVGVVWPSVFKKLRTTGQVLAAGAGFSLLIEVIQLPFFDRVTDIDDLILNTLGFAAGYGIYLLIRLLTQKNNI